MSTTTTDDFAELDALANAILADSFEQKWRREHPYTADLLQILLPLGSRGLPRTRVITEVALIRRKHDLPIPASFDETVQSVFNQHCVNSLVFRKRNIPSDGLFSSRRDGREAIWSVIPEVAQAWLLARQ